MNVIISFKDIDYCDGGRVWRGESSCWRGWEAGGGGG